MASSRPRLSPPRLVGGFLLIGAAAALLLAFARALPPDNAGGGGAFVIGIVLMPLIASPLEWLVHRYVYHRGLPGLRAIRDIHHRVHHHVYFPTWRYVTTGAPRRIPVFAAQHDRAATTAAGNAAVHLAHWTFYMLIAAAFIWVPCAALGARGELLGGVIVASMVVSELMIAVHDAIHRPGTYPLIERRAWFRYLDEHHFVHHVDTAANVNFLLPLCDWLVGTLRRRLTDQELRKHGTWAEAKRRPIGSGEPAHAAVAARPTTTPADDRPVVAGP